MKIVRGVMLAGILFLTATSLWTNAIAGEGNANWCENNCSGASKLIPQNDWDFMYGYRYKYSETCTVTWHPRGATFLVPTSCPKFSEEKIANDAKKSMAYVKQTNAKDFADYYDSLKTNPEVRNSTQTYSIEQSRQDARQIWVQACLNAKSLKGVPAFKFFEQYPNIKNVHVGRLFANANQTVQNLGGMVNCSELGQYAADTYTSDIDIRTK